MGRVTITTYVCDCCGMKFDKAKDLRKFAVQLRTSRNWEESTADLCAECEWKLLGWLGEKNLFDGTELNELARDVP